MKMKLSIVLFPVLLALVACQRPSDAPKPNVSNSTTVPSVAEPGAPASGISSAESKDPSMPSSATQTPGPSTSESQKMTNPRAKMTTEEESTAMPKPGQANDHSSTALDAKK